jgi:hypothetical protein
VRSLTFLIAFFLLLGTSIVHAGAAANYVEQVGVAFATVSAQTLAYNVTATTQKSADGFGPAYLLNGMSAEHYWYQVGLAYDWPDNSSAGSYNGFAMIYDAFGPNGNVISPTSGGSGIISLSGPVYNGDEVLLAMSFQNGNILLNVKDWDTNATSILVLNASGQTSFVGSLHGGNLGLSTGLMTEWYHTDPYYRPEKVVTYSPAGYMPQGQSYIWADEYCVHPCSYNYSYGGYYYDNTLFYVNSTPVSSNSLLDFSRYVYQYGVDSELYGNGTFVTGSVSGAGRMAITASSLGTFTTETNRVKNADYIVIITGGAPPYEYSTYLNGRLYSSNESIGISYNGSISSAGLSPGVNYYYVQVTDSAGNEAKTKAQDITIISQPHLTINNFNAIIDENQVLKLSYNITGGTPPYNVEWYLNGEQPSSGNTVPIDTVGVNRLEVVVTDAENVTTDTNETLYVNSPPRLNLTINPAKGNLYLNEKIAITANTTGGTPPYTYAMYVDGQEVNYTDSISFNKTGTHSVIIASEDSKGVSSSEMLSIPVVEHDYSLFFMIAFAILVVLGYCVWYMRRVKKGKAKAGANQQA